MNLESVTMTSSGVGAPLKWFGFSIATAYVGAILLPYRVLPYPEFLMNSWMILLTSTGLLIWFSTRGPGKITKSGITWISLAILIAGQSLIIKPAYLDSLIFPIAALVTATLLNLAISNSNDRERSALLVMLCAAFTTASFGTFVIQTIQLLTPADLTPGWVIPIQGESQPNGNVAQRNQAAFIHSLGLAGALWLSLKFKSLPTSFSTKIFIFSAGVGIAMTGSRLGMVLGFFATTAGSWKILQESSQTCKKFSVLVNVFIYIAGYLAFLYWYENQPFKHQFLTATDRWQAVSNLSRYALQEQAWQMFWSSPFIGKGWGSFIGEGLKNAENSALPLFADDSHFFFSQIASELGIFGLLAIFPATHSIYKAIFTKAIRKNSCQWIILVIFGLYSCTEYPLWNINYLAIFSILIALHETEAEEIFKNNTSKIGSAAPAVIFSAILALGSFYWGKSYLDLHRLGSAFLQSNATSKKETIEKISNHGYIFGLSPISDYYDYVLLDYTSENIEEKIGLGTRVLSRFVAPNVLEKHGLLLIINQEEEKAIPMFKALCLYYPQECMPFTERLKYIAQKKGGGFAYVHALIIDWIKSVDEK